MVNSNSGSNSNKPYEAPLDRCGAFRLEYCFAMLVGVTYVLSTVAAFTSPRAHFIYDLGFEAGADYYWAKQVEHRPNTGGNHRQDFNEPSYG